MNTNEASTSGGGKFHTVQPLRDLESNWEVDLANNLQEYLLKICSGEITGGEDDSHLSVNFAEAALLLQGSIQVYSRKVEYLYSLVVHALEFISQQSKQHDQPENAAPGQEEENGPVVTPTEPDDSFWGSDDIQVDAKNSLDRSKDSNTLLNSHVKPPANLVVLEGDCLDTSGDSGELESYLLATNDLYKDFILLDACDAVAVDEFLNGNDEVNKTKNNSRGSSIGSKSRKTFMSPSRRSGGFMSPSRRSGGFMSPSRRSAGKTVDPGPSQNAYDDKKFETNDHHMDDHGFDMDDGFSQPEAFDDDSDEEDEEDPWKPLNPHEKGNLKIKPFKKVKVYRKDWPKPTTKVSITEEFPLAKLHGPISVELHEIWEAQHGKDHESQSPPYYEKLRQSLVEGDDENIGTFNNNDKDDEDDVYDSGGHDFMPDDDYMNEDHFNHENHMDDATQFDSKEPVEHEEPKSHENLEDLCRSHLDSLLASISETEKQTALAARVSTWKQRIEQNLDEQDARPPFDIHEYGQRTLDKLSFQEDVGNSMSFTDVVRGLEKHDVARTFSALLQLVNNGNVELERGGIEGGHVCYTGENPFHVRLLTNVKRPEVRLRSANKRPKAQMKRGKENHSPPGSVSPPRSIKVGKVGGIRRTPESKRRRRSRLVDHDGLMMSPG
ncbi:condensin-2 complex subunit H2 [Lactuca sativa]|uniref:condensin-2 complex subunit H2 n=1 Tax=Lactuca sativa TaxID=4236 RepID=UPI000CA721C2|nr:condensin-2 complex subunit H2 [Lactuca sativa]